MFNPWTILGAVLIGLALWFGGNYVGYQNGEHAAKVEAQKEFDKVNKAITEQKAEAAKLYRAAQADIIALQAARDTLKTNLETDRAKNRRDTDALRTQLAGERLRFAAQSAGVGPNGSSTMPAGSNAASDPGAAECIVSESVDRDLKALAYDADTLRDDYKTLYDWAHNVK